MSISQTAGHILSQKLLKGPQIAHRKPREKPQEIFLTEGKHFTQEVPKASNIIPYVCIYLQYLPDVKHILVRV